MFQNLQIMWQDPNGRKKIFFFVGVGLGVILLIALIIRLNFGGGSNTAIQNVNSNITQQIGYKQEVTTQSFGDSQVLEKIDSSSVSSASVVFSGSNQAIYLNADFKLRVKNTDIPNSPSFANPKIINTAEGVILNEPNRTTILQPNNSFRKIDNNYSLNQYFVVSSGKLITKWAYISFANNSYTVKTADDINFSKEIIVANITPTISARMAELVNFNQKIYLVAWENINRQGNMEVWQIKEAGTPAIKVFSKAQVQSVSYGSDSMLVTTFSLKPTELTLYQNTWLDFKLNPAGNPTDLQLDFNLSQANVFGSLLAERCYVDLGGKAYCLVKEKKVTQNSYVSKDVILKIDLRLGGVSKIQENLAISASNIYLDSTGGIYIVSQEEKILYKVKV